MPSSTAPIDVEQRLDDGGDVVFERLLARGLGDRSVSRFRRQSREQRLGERRGVARRNEPAGAPVVDELGEAARPAGDDRHAQRHRLQRNVAEALPERGEDGELRAGDDRERLLARKLTGEPHARRDRRDRPPHALRQRAALRARVRADQDRVGLWMRAEGRREGLGQLLDALPPLDPPEEDEEALR
jgi:hypothetical protein